MSIIDRLLYIQGELQKLKDRDYIKPDGGPIFAGAKQELDDVIATWVEPSSAPATVTLAAMTPEQVEDVVARVTANADANKGALAGQIEQIATTIDTNANDARANADATLNAVNTTRTDVLAAIDATHSAA